VRTTRGSPAGRRGRLVCSCGWRRPQVARQAIAPAYWPERLELIEALPMTASGKVQKFRLRELIAETLRAERA
jgi:acyl-coenzyme A synthetase/AMP-(fatty) acid ligase